VGFWIEREVLSPVMDSVCVVENEAATSRWWEAGEIDDLLISWWPSMST
jgi:hypothetical protein